LRDTINNRRYMKNTILPTPKEFDLEASLERCRKIRRRILDVSQRIPAIHIGGSFSCLEMLDVIYHGLMRKTTDGDYWDTFILSKGHASFVWFVTLESLGILPTEEIERYCSKEGILGMHPDRGTPGIITSTGSLGHGLGMGAGMALHEKVFKDDRNIYVLLSDGELQEGSVWEIFLQAPALGLNSLVGFVDNNNLQSMDFTSESHPNFYPIKEKLEAFGWESDEVDGHDQQQIYDAIKNRTGDKPFFLVGKTVKGKGVSYMENVPMWHYRSPNPDEYQQALKELSE
jgi:transketolase